MKKFLKYFIIICLVSFAILNSRFVSAQFIYWLDGLGLVNEQRGNKTLTNTTLPISKSNYYFIDIPAIGVTAPVILEKSNNPNTIFKRLEDGVVHYADTPLPGQDGTAIILGHSSAYPWYKGSYGSVFALLGKLKAGDEIRITNGEKTLTYKVSGSLIFNPFGKNEQLQELGRSDHSSIILVSCWPVGTNYKRIAVKADLI